MATYRIMGRRWLRKYTAPQISPVYAASVDARMVVESLCDVPWTRTFTKDARMTYHTDEVISKDPDITGLDMNVIIRDSFDAALFCADHKGGQHRAFANVACYRYTMPDEAVGKSISALNIEVTSDPYNSKGVRLHTFTNTTGEIPMNCHTLRGEDAGGEIIDDGTTAAGVAPRTTETRGETDYWYPTMTTVTLAPSGGMVLQRYLFIVVALESYSTVRGNWLEGSSFITNDVSIDISAPVEGWSDTEVNDLSDSDGIVEIPVVRHGTTQCNFSEVTGMCSVAVLSNGDDFNGAFDADGQRRYRIPPYQRQLYAPETYDADPTRFYIGLRALYAKFYGGNMEMAKRPHARLRPGAGFSVRPHTWPILDASGAEANVQGWSIAASVTALAFSAPLSLSVIKMRLDWGASGSGTGGTVNGGHYNFWLKRGTYADNLPESLVKNPDIYTASKSSVDGWEYLGSSSGDFFEVELSEPLNSEHATVLVTAYADQKSTMSTGFMSGTNPWGASTEFDILPSGANPDFSVNTGIATSANSLMTPDITLYGVGEEEEATPYLPWWLCFTAEEANSTVSMSSSGTTPPELDLKTSIDGGQTWTPFVVGSTTITLPNIGDKVYFAAGEGGNSTICSSEGYNEFDMTGRIAASGDVTSLLDADSSSQTIQNSLCFVGLFSNCTSLTTAPKLPSTVLSEACYAEMFIDCSSLVSAPELPATTLAANCYNSMFRGCTSLVLAPELPAMTLAPSCYYDMFAGCASLISAPELPAMTLAPSCYAGMFGENVARPATYCTSLRVAPHLPATTLARDCYRGMFKGCSSLSIAPELPATTLAPRCYEGMFKNCMSLTTAPELPAMTLEEACYANMFSGCTSLTTAPTLAATTMIPSRTEGTVFYLGGYYEMFSGCTLINEITTSQTSFDGCESWLRYVAATGTFYCPASLGTNETITRGYNYCPEGWTVINIQTSDT